MRRLITFISMLCAVSCAWDKRCLLKSPTYSQAAMEDPGEAIPSSCSISSIIRE